MLSRPTLFLILLLLFASFVHAQEKTGKKVPPQYEEGDYEFRKILLNNFLELPQQAYDSCLQGTVVLSFTVRTDGSLDSIITLHSAHPVLDQHAYIFLYKTNNKWKPGTLDGVPVAMRKTIPFVYGSFNEIKDSKNYNLAQIGMLRTVVGSTGVFYGNTDRRTRAKDYSLAQANMRRTKVDDYEYCPQAHDFYKQGQKLYKEQQYEEAYRFFENAHRRDFMHLDAINMLKKTADKLEKPCDVCEKLALLARYSDREIKRVRDQYCTKDFKPL